MHTTSLTRLLTLVTGLFLAASVLLLPTFASAESSGGLAPIVHADGGGTITPDDGGGTRCC